MSVDKPLDDVIAAKGGKGKGKGRWEEGWQRAWGKVLVKGAESGMGRVDGNQSASVINGSDNCHIL